MPSAQLSNRQVCCRESSTCRADFVRYRSSRDRSTRNELALRHEWLAVQHACRFRDRGQPVEDLVQVAWIGLIKAIERFDPERGVSFPAFATPTIVGELKRHFRDYSWDVKVPRRAKEARTGVRLAIELLHQRLNRSPTTAELADYLGLPLETVIETLAAMSAHRTRPLDVGAPGSPLLRDIEGERAEELVEERLMTSLAAARLSARDRLILYWRFFEDCTQEEIAERIGVSQVQVSRRLAVSLAVLRGHLQPAA